MELDVFHPQAAAAKSFCLLVIILLIPSPAQG